MTPYTLAWFERRTELMLKKFGLTEPVHEPIYRERMPADGNWTRFTKDEAEGLMVLAELTKEVRG